MFFYLFAFFLFLVDQGTKFLVSSQMTLDSSIPIFPPVLYFTYIQNPGAAWGIFSHQLWLLIPIALLCVIFIIVAQRKIPKESVFLRTAAAFLLAGALGNSFDRIVHGKVTDFINFEIFHYPIFNMADIFVNLAVLFYIIHLFKQKKSN